MSVTETIERSTAGVTPEKKSVSKDHISVGLRAETMPRMYREAAAVWGRRPAFAHRVKGKVTETKDPLWEPTTYEQLYKDGAALATALIDLGVEGGDRVGLFADNRIEWIIANFGIQLAGCPDVPRGADVTENDVLHILPHSGATACFVETAKLWEMIKPLKSKLSGVRHWILMDPKDQASDGVLHMNDLIAKGHALRESGDRRAEARTDAVKAEDLATLIYTSGTTGQPKGVMLSHKNLLYGIERVVVELTPNDRILSLLPVWHIFERVFEIIAISRGICTYYSSVRHLAEDFRIVQPTFMGSAPRLWESLYIRIKDGLGKAHPVRRALFHTAYFLSSLYRGSLNWMLGHKLQLTKMNPIVYFVGWLLHFVRFLLVVPFYGFFNVAVLERLRQGLGASLKGTVSGGGALPKHVDEFFNNIGIPVLEGYGMTETAAVLCARRPDDLVLGTVGPPAEGTELRIIDLGSGEILYPNPQKPYNGKGLKGEIHVRGEQIMMGYYNNPEATAKVFDDARFLNTGDVGMVTFTGSVKIMGRSKDTIVLANGENVEPVPIENRLLQSTLIDNVMLVGQDQRFLAALIVPSLEGLQEHGIKIDTLEEAVGHEGARRLIGEEIRREISAEFGFKSFERVQDFRILGKTFEVGDELTNLFKLKRNVITEKYQNLVDEIYKEK